MQIGKHHSVAR